MQFEYSEDGINFKPVMCFTMIDPKELRIGNHYYFSVHTKNGFRKVAVQMDEDRLEILYAARNYVEFEPIPLSPEVLEAAGFEKSKQHQSEYYKESFCFKLGYVIKYQGHYYREIKYLHQLQNLYFAITGEELQFVPRNTV